MKLKSQPNDFIVEEIYSFKLVPSGPFMIYKVEKTDMDTSVALGHIAKRAGIPVSDIGYAGIKDKHAKTIQFISLPSTIKQIFLSEPKLRVSAMGFSASPIQLGDHESNKFTITVRQILLGRVEAVKKRAAFAFENPIPNYYDSQRFGSFIQGESIGVHVLQENYDKALKVYLTGFRKSDPSHVKADKRLILGAWPNVGALKLNDRVFSDICSTYAKTSDWKAAYERIPLFEREMHVQAVASYIWNEALKMLLKEVKTEKTFSVEYAAGSLLFGMPEKELPVTLANRKDVITAVCSRDSLPMPTRFDWDRPLFFKVIDGKILDTSTDESAKRPDQMQKITFSFSLPTGCYATVVLKAIMRA